MECDIQDKWANVVGAIGKPGGAKQRSHSYRGGRRGGWRNPQGKTAHLAPAGVAGVWWGQLRPQQVLRAVTQSLCEDKNAVWEMLGEQGRKPSGLPTHLLCPGIS